MAREISDKQLVANRRNARRSTGPRTPEGKERARFNALKHGPLARSVVVPTRDGPENRKQFERLLTQLRDKLNPDGILEEMLVEKIAVAYCTGGPQLSAVVSLFMCQRFAQQAVRHPVPRLPVFVIVLLSP